VRKADNLPPYCAVVMKSGNLNFLEPSGPVQASNGTALPLQCGIGCSCILQSTGLSKASRVSNVMCAIIKIIIAVSFLYPAFLVMP